MKNIILVSVQNPSVQESSVEYGVALGKSLNLPVKLVSFRQMMFVPVTAYDVSSIPEYADDGDERSHNLFEERMIELCNELKKEWPHVDYDFEIGFDEMGVVEKANEDQPFLLVVGKGPEENVGLLNELFGTRATHIAEKAGCPVLVVPEKAAFRPPEHIVYFTEFESQKDENEVVSFFSRLTEEWPSRITVVISGNNSTAEETTEIVALMRKLHERLPEGQIEYRQIYSEHKVRNLNQILEQKDTDWFALSQINSSFFEKLIHDLNDEHLILSSEIPVLVF